MHLVLGKRVLAPIMQLGEALIVHIAKRQRGTGALYPTRQSTVGALLELGKSVDLPLDGKRLSRESQARLSERKT